MSRSPRRGTPRGAGRSVGFIAIGAIGALAITSAGLAGASALINGRSIKPGSVPLTALSAPVRAAIASHGVQGLQGLTGPQGTQGAAGAQGPVGPQGAPGATRVSLGKTESIVLPPIKGAGFLNLRCQDGGYPVSASFGPTPDGVLFSGSTPTRQGDVPGFTVYLSNVGAQPATVTARAVCVS